MLSTSFLCENFFSELPRVSTDIKYPANAIWYSIISTTYANGLNVERYLIDLFSSPDGNIRRLLPMHGVSSFH